MHWMYQEKIQRTLFKDS